MKVEFNFDGERVHIRLRVEGKYETAMAELMESYNVATVTVGRGREYGYSAYHAPATEVNICLRRPQGHEEQG